MVIHYHPPVFLNIFNHQFLLWDIFFFFSLFIFCVLTLYYARYRKDLNEKIMLQLHIIAAFLVIFIGWGIPRLIVGSNMSSLRGMLVLFLGLAGYMKLRKISFRYLDVYALFSFVGLAIGRVGCLLNWCCWGITTNLPWGFEVIPDFAVHPTQIYSIFIALFLFSIFFYYRDAKFFVEKPGNLFLAAFSSYTFLRLVFIEPLRMGVGTFDGFLRATLLFLMFIVSSLVFLWINRKKR